MMAGLIDETADLTVNMGGANGYSVLLYDGYSYHNGSASACLPAFALGDTLMQAFNPTTRKLWFGRNGTWFGDPAAGTGEAYTVASGFTYHPGMSGYNAGTVVNLRALSANQTYAAPTGYTAAGD